MVKEEKMEETLEENLVDEVEEAKVTETEAPKEETPESEAPKVEKEAQERLIRLQADFENFKKRTQKEKADIYQFALEGFVTKLLPVLDNLERAESAANDENKDSYREGVQMVFKQLMGVLNEEGLKAIETEGTSFDPNYHHGVAVGESEEKEDQAILEVFQKGYTFKDKVIRPAMVKVNQK